MEPEETIILGAGVTGLTVGIKTGAPIFEANPHPGGICHSYLKNGYRFEFGGGHWIFGDDKQILNFIDSLSPLKKYQRKSAVYFPNMDLFVPYPLQNNLSYLPKTIAQKALSEMEKIKKVRKKIPVETSLANWLEVNFGPTLCELFFSPFHQLYTAGLYTKIVPQDQFKTPTNKKNSGYNKTFVYPKKGLADFIKNMAKKCQVNYKRIVARINIKKKEISFEEGTKLKYNQIISTLPLNKMAKMAKISSEEIPAPYTSLMIINIGAKKGKKCPPYHWLYFPKTKSGFYRVGFYSNVDRSFLPSHSIENKISLYVDKAYPGGKKPTNREVKKLVKDITNELQKWQFIDQLEIVDPNWIEVAYTWSLPNSKWREKTLKILRENDIYQIGRFGQWQFQGILESIKEGLDFSFPEKPFI